MEWFIGFVVVAGIGTGLFFLIRNENRQVAKQQALHEADYNRPERRYARALEAKLIAEKEFSDAEKVLNESRATPT